VRRSFTSLVDRLEAQGASRCGKEEVLCHCHRLRYVCNVYSALTYRAQGHKYRMRYFSYRR